MARRKLSLPMIRRAVRALPDVEEGTSYRTPAWRYRGKLLARLTTTSAIRWYWRASTG